MRPCKQFNSDSVTFVKKNVNVTVKGNVFTDLGSNFDYTLT